MTRQPLALAALLLVTACKGQDKDPKVSHAWVRLPAVAGQPAAAYFNLEGGSSADKLIRVESALASKIELHESMAGDHGMMTMTPTEAIALAPGVTVSFAPGGKHAMVYGLDKVVVPGTAVPLRFGFASGKTAEAEAKSVSAGESAPY
jgi:copper(I)-binding protein